MMQAVEGLYIYKYEEITYVFTDHFSTDACSIYYNHRN